jgi:phosphoglycolate phosphatase-like HAD superfamily hydrolase
MSWHPGIAHALPSRPPFHLSALDVGTYASVFVVAVELAGAATAAAPAVASLGTWGAGLLSLITLGVHIYNKAKVGKEKRLEEQLADVTAENTRLRREMDRRAEAEAQRVGQMERRVGDLERQYGALFDEKLAQTRRLAELEGEMTVLTLENRALNRALLVQTGYLRPFDRDVNVTVQAGPATPAPNPNPNPPAPEAPGATTP